MAAKSPTETTILVLISEPLLRVVIQEVLERAGYLVMSTGDLGTAVDRTRECKPDMLVISPYVDNISGHDAARYLQARCPTMRLLMVAGLLADDRLEYRAELERIEIFPKPFGAQELVDKVRLVMSEDRTPVARAGAR